MHDGRWAVIWSDTSETDKILNASESQISKWYEKMKAGQLKFKLPSIEYTTGHSESEQPLDFEHEATLINSLEPLNQNRFFEEVSVRDPFKPFVAMIEGEFLLIYNLAEYFKYRWTYLKQSHLVSEDSVNKIDAFLELADWEIEEQFKKKDESSKKDAFETFDIDLIKEAERRNSTANQMVYNHVVKKKPVNTVAFKGNSYLSVTFEDPMKPPTILFPESSRDSIPDAPSFYGRVCGIVNYVANPAPLTHNLILQSVILAIPMNINPVR